MVDAKPSSFYLTTAIDYPNGAPHIGHALEKVAADVVARYHRLRGADTAFTMGLDVNSQHILTAAAKNNVSSGDWVAQMDVAFRRAWDALDISRTSWVLTNSNERHRRASEELFRRAQSNGDIYKSTYAGWYCPNCNNYYAETELVDGHCPLHPTVAPEWLEEENYFFALSNYTDRLRAHLAANPDFITPATWRPEMVSLLEAGLRDFSISREVRADREPWGIPVPGDPKHVLYVWFDALTTYISGIGFPDDMETFDRYWPADSHVIGVDIQRFHCLYWPAMLLSAGIALPKRIVVHGFITLEGKRISTSLGNVLDPVDVIAEFGVDPVRYYLTRDFSFKSSGDFNRANLLRRYNDDLGNDLGNLLNRVVAMIGRYRQGTIPAPGEPGDLERDLRSVAESAHSRAAGQLESWEVDAAVQTLWTLVRRANQYLEERQPWRLAKQPEAAETLDTVLWSAAEATRLIALSISPFLPTTADRILAQLGLPRASPGDWTVRGEWGSQKFTAVAPDAPLFPKIES